MISRFKAPGTVRWLSLIATVVMILGLTPAALAATTVPGAPTGLDAVAGINPGEVGLTWTAPLDDGGSAITDYRVQYREPPGDWLGYPDGVSTNEYATVTLLTPGKTYEFRVRARNAVGWSLPSNVDSLVLPATTAPNAPRTLAAAAGPGAGQMTLTWLAPLAGTGPDLDLSVTDYRVQFRLSTDAIWTTYADGVSPLTGATISFLAPNKEYKFRVRARNAIGLGDWSTVATQTTSAAATVPGAPTLQSPPTVGIDQVTLTWLAPASNGGSAITDYRLQYKLSTATAWSTYPEGVSTDLFATATLLTGGQSYDFRVRARNSIGWGPPSNVVSATPTAELTRPAAPTLLTAVAGEEQVALTWSAPLRGGVADTTVTDYRVEYKEYGDISWTTFPDGVSTTLSATVIWLAAEQKYEFRVKAINDAGIGVPSNVLEATPLVDTP